MSGRESIRVLIAEDSYAIGISTEKMLEAMGYTPVGRAMDGQQAVEMVEAMHPDVILMDIEMPELDGLEATRLIQERCPTPVVVLTGYETPELLERAVVVGVGAYLIKPPGAPELDRAIRIAIARFEDMIELRRLNAKLRAESAERKRAEEQLQASLLEKETLLKEIYHRVKNNLQLVSSLLDLQSESVQDPQALQVLQDSQDRVRSMALIHQELYQSSDLESINAADYVRNIAYHLFYAYGGPEKSIALKVRVADIRLGIDVAIPCGLIVNELVSNALKYAFAREMERPVGERNEICVELSAAEGDEFTLAVRDNGVGLPPDLNLENPPSLGLQLVNLLARQLEAVLEVNPASAGAGKEPMGSVGTTFRITFADQPTS